MARSELMWQSFYRQDVTGPPGYITPLDAAQQRDGGGAWDLLNGSRGSRRIEQGNSRSHGQSYDRRDRDIRKATPRD
jgi:hypothetical protein